MCPSNRTSNSVSLESLECKSEKLGEELMVCDVDSWYVLVQSYRTTVLAVLQIRKIKPPPMWLCYANVCLWTYLFPRQINKTCHYYFEIEIRNLANWNCC